MMTHTILTRPEAQFIALSATLGALAHVIPDIAALGALGYYAVSTYFLIKNKGK